MHTPSGCAYGCPSGAPIIGRDLFFSLLVARPLAFGSLPAPMHHLRWCIWVPLWGTHYNTCKRSPLVITRRVNFGQNYRDLGHFVRVTLCQITGTLSGTSMGTLSGTHMWAPYGHPHVQHISGYLFSSWSHTMVLPYFSRFHFVK